MSVQIDDGDLVARTLRGDREAFGAIVARYEKAVFGVAMARVGSFHDAQDVAQNVFAEGFERLSGLRDAQKLGAWLRKMAIHRSLDFVKTRREVRDIEGLDLRSPNEMPARELREEVLAAVSRLGASQREAVMLFYFGGYSLADIAELCEVTVARVKSRLHEARKRLREEMAVMVEDVLKFEGANDDLAQRVFEAITQSVGWLSLVSAVNAVGTKKDIAGVAQALESRDWRHRRNALKVEHLFHAPETIEQLLELLKKMLTDSNKKVRTAAVEGLMNTNIPEQRMIEEVVPLVVPMLDDPSRRVRRRAAIFLLRFAEHVPAEAAARMVLKDPAGARSWMVSGLLRATTKGK